MTCESRQPRSAYSNGCGSYAHEHRGHNRRRNNHPRRALSRGRHPLVPMEPPNGGRARGRDGADREDRSACAPSARVRREEVLVMTFALLLLVPLAGVCAAFLLAAYDNQTSSNPYSELDE